MEASRFVAQHVKNKDKFEQVSERKKKQFSFENGIFHKSTATEGGKKHIFG